MFEIIKGQLSPSVSDTITVDGAAFNLTGCTVAFSMRAAGSSILKVDHAVATIISPTAGTVQYNWSAGDTDTDGLYVFWWTVTLVGGESQDTPESDLRISDHSVAANALCTLTDVHLAMETPSSDTSLDDVIQEYINEASELIIKSYRREFAPVTTSATRRFRVSTKGKINLLPYDLQSVSQVMLHPEQSQQIIASGDYSLFPTTNYNGVYMSMRISPWIPLVSLNYLKFGYALVDITGTWGFPSVPAPVKRAAVITVRTWLRKDAKGMAGSAGGQYYSGQELPAELPSTYALPAAARKLLMPYKRDLGAS